MDENYERLFNFLIENYNFKPKFLMIDFEVALTAAIKKNDYMKNNTIHLKCLFHFSQMLIRKLSNLGFKKKKLNKQLIEIIRNIQILVFLKKEKIQDFEKIILNEINKFDDISKFRKYLQKYIFKIINEGYNFEKLMNIMKKIIKNA